MPEYSNYLESRNPLTDEEVEGDEILGCSKDGNARSLTSQQIANLGGGTGSGITREFNRAFSSELLFDKNEIHYAQHTLTGDTNFTVAASGHLEDQACIIIQEIVTDGTHQVTFETYNQIEGVGFKYVNPFILENSTPPAGTYFVMYLYWNGVTKVVWDYPSSEVANLTQLTAPANFAATATSETNIDLSWTNNALAVELEIQVSSDGVNYSPLTTVDEGTTTFAHTPLTANTTYHYRARWVGDGVQYSNSPWVTASAMTQDAGDVTAPVATFTPLTAATDVVVNRRIIIDFDESIIDADGVTVITNANVDDYITLKETDGSGTDIPFTATINDTKTQILIDATGSLGQTQVVFVEVDGIEDNNGNEASAQSATFTTGEYAEFNGTSNRVGFGSILGSTVFSVNDTNFELELTIRDYLTTAGNRILISKADSGAIEKTFNLYTVGADVRFAYYMSNGSNRFISWANALDGNEHTVTLKYDGSIDTNNGLDRVILEIDGIPAGSKTLASQSGASLSGQLHGSTGQLAVSINLTGPGVPVSSSFFTGQAKDFIVRSNSGGTVEINVPDLRSGVDISGNDFHGTWV